MKNFFTGFFFTNLLIIVCIGFPMLSSLIFESLGYDEQIGLGVGLALLAGIMVGILSMLDD